MVRILFFLLIAVASSAQAVKPKQESVKIDTAYVVFYPKEAQLKAIEQAFIKAQQAEQQKWDLVFLLMGEPIDKNTFVWDDKNKRFIAKKAK